MPSLKSRRVQDSRIGLEHVIYAHGSAEGACNTIKVILAPFTPLPFERHWLHNVRNLDSQSIVLFAPPNREMSIGRATGQIVSILVLPVSREQWTLYAWQAAAAPCAMDSAAPDLGNLGKHSCLMEKLQVSYGRMAAKVQPLA